MFGLFSVGFLVFAAKALKIKILAGSATDPEKQEAEERPAIVLAMSPKSNTQGKLIFRFIREMLISYILKDVFQVTLHVQFTSAPFKPFNHQKWSCPLLPL